MNLDSFYTGQFAQHAQIVAATENAVRVDFMRLAAAAAAALVAGHKIIFFGNGGSAGDAQHLAAEFVGRYELDRRALAAIALTTDSSALTAIGNDYGFEQVFARQMRALGQVGDVAIGISTSGNSANVVAALRVARDMGLVTAGFSGETGGSMVDAADIVLRVPSRVTARIQEMHIMLGQMLVGATERLLGLRED